MKKKYGTYVATDELGMFLNLVEWEAGHKAIKGLKKVDNNTWHVNMKLKKATWNNLYREWHIIKKAYLIKDRES